MISVRCKLVLPALLAMFAMTGCGSSDVTYGHGRVVNALVGVPNPQQDPKGPALDFISSSSADGLQNIAFGVSSPYFSVPHDNINVSAFQHSTSTALVPQGRIDLQGDVYHTIIAAGVANTTGTMAPQFFYFRDTVPTMSIVPPTIALRLVNASPDSPPVDVFLGTTVSAPGAPIAGLNNISYGNASNYIIVPADSTTLSIHSSATGAVLLTPSLLRGFAASPGAAYTIFVVGLNKPTNNLEGLDAKITEDNK